MKITADPANPQTWPTGRVNTEWLDATTESELAANQASDDARAEHDATKSTRHVRKRLEQTQPDGDSKAFTVGT